MNYVAIGASNPLKTLGIPWCRICQTRGHKFEECPYLHNIVSEPASLHCKFCRSIGHDEKECRALQLLQEKTMDTYLMKNDEKMQAERAQPQYHPAQYQQLQYPQPQYLQNHYPQQ